MAFFLFSLLLLATLLVIIQNHLGVFFVHMISNRCYELLPIHESQVSHYIHLNMLVSITLILIRYWILVAHCSVMFTIVGFILLVFLISIEKNTTLKMDMKMKSESWQLIFMFLTRSVLIFALSKWDNNAKVN